MLLPLSFKILFEANVTNWYMICWITHLILMSFRISIYFLHWLLLESSPNVRRFFYLTFQRWMLKDCKTLIYLENFPLCYKENSSLFKIHMNDIQTNFKGLPSLQVWNGYVTRFLQFTRKLNSEVLQGKFN
jgi:hypothetical protein